MGKISKTCLRDLCKIKMYLSNFRVVHWRAYMGLSFLPFLDGISENLTNIALARAFLINLTTISCFLAFTFGLNNCFDIETDMAEGDLDKNPIAVGKISFKSALMASLAVGFLGVTILIFYVPIYTVIFIYLLLLFLGGFYSAPPLRFKSKPFLDIISHGLFFGSLLYIYGYLIRGVNVWTIVKSPLVLLIFTYSVILNMRNHWEDYNFDLEANINTTATYLGYERTKKAIIFLIQIHWILLLTLSLIISLYFFLEILTLFLISNVLFSLKLIKFEKWLRTIDILTIISYILFSLY